MSNQTKTKIYCVEIVATISASATFEVKAFSEIEAIATAEQLFEEYLTCTNKWTDGNGIDCHVVETDSTATQEEE
ncbi:MAG: hypothetical protein CLLPBCKN_007200 [Chroococcidiopsis cubana SAG 39.79]|uniref:Uncharacterized protein n=1 Tax=Chroococcidiopsis cubana SAG 39.79 TaxID=388085 RepID=A0AB37URQ3_9CYAN|nr:hypothetical protein [Chroococcidiopsis cubana]MDZ4877765.1 hypothetical protein [Chroococcidiopsis cubana SAG 39.79]PSB62050.1 hypothetical protein C7B79_19605 [Chroococcidiopsis cubana CCALA 043]RUT14047.1 hypothetical protein DSM107010_05300 [Chroococcidiopsis cubana SAG 39.79]